MEVDNLSSVDSKLKVSDKVTNKVNGVSEADLSMSELELLANQNKVKKEKLEVDVKDIDLEKLSDSFKVNTPSVRSSVKKTNTKMRDATSNSTSQINSSRANKEKVRRVNKENKDESIKREKIIYLYKINTLNQKKNVSFIKLDMNCSLDEIKNEYERIRSTLENEKMVKFCKQMLLMGVQGVEMLNTRYDPFGVDLIGWHEAMGYSMENQEYDEVLSELYEKYKGKGQMSPELKLVLMICGSAAMFGVTKKLSKIDVNNDNLFNNILGGFMNNKPAQMSPEQYQQQQPEQYQQQQPQQYQQQPPVAYQVPPRGMSNFIPSPADLRDNISDTSSNLPSRMKGPRGQYESPESIEIQNIIKTMNENKKNKVDNNNFLSTDEPEERQIKPKTNKRGRPPANKAKTTRGIIG